MTKKKNQKSLEDMVELCLTAVSQLTTTVESMQKSPQTKAKTKSEKSDGKTGEFTPHICVYSDPKPSKDNDFMEFKIRGNKYPEFADGVYPQKAIHVNQLVKEGVVQSVGITVWNGKKSRRVSCYIPASEISTVIQEIEKNAL